MNTEKRRIAIAKVCGWTDIETLVDGFENRRWEFYTNEPNYYPDESYHVGSLVGSDPNRPGKLSHVPDYLNDLNAMHEAERVLTPEQRYHYANRVASMADAGWGFSALHADANLRSEAFCKTMNLEDEQ